MYKFSSEFVQTIVQGEPCVATFSTFGSPFPPQEALSSTPGSFNSDFQLLHMLMLSNEWPTSHGWHSFPEYGLRRKHRFALNHIHKTL